MSAHTFAQKHDALLGAEGPDASNADHALRDLARARVALCGLLVDCNGHGDADGLFSILEVLAYVEDASARLVREMLVASRDERGAAPGQVPS